MKFNRTKFFNQFRSFYKESTKQSLDRQIVSSMEFLLASFEKQVVITFLPQIAYSLATIAHETAWTFRPIREYRAKTGTKGRFDQDRYWLTGFYGRGFVQLTWERNYRLLGYKIGVDLVSNPDLALKPEIAFQILTLGMSDGLFTGKKLSDYIHTEKLDYVGARRIVNGTDRAELIAAYAKTFEIILSSSLDAEQAIEQPPQVAVQTFDAEIKQKVSIKNEQSVTDAAQVEEPKPQGIFSKLTGGVSALFSGTLLYSVLERSGNISLSQTALILLIVAIVIAFLGFCFWAALDAWKANQRLHYEVEAKTDPNKIDLEWKK